jgi:hypothetical protein
LGKRRQGAKREAEKRTASQAGAGTRLRVRSITMRAICASDSTKLRSSGRGLRGVQFPSGSLVTAF